jgi:hypothetical protein
MGGCGRRKEEALATLQQVRETLTLSAGAINLVQPVIDRMLFEGVRKHTPLRRLIPRKTWTTNTYIFNKRSKYPSAQFTTEAPPTSGTGSVAPSSSVYTQLNYPIKHTQVNLDLSEFSIQIARVNGDLVDLELDGSSKAMVYLEEMAHLFGSAGATLNTARPQWDGFDMLLNPANKLDSSGAVITLAMLDSMIDKVKAALAAELGANYFFLASPELISAINRLVLQYLRYNGAMKVFVRDDYGIPNAPVVDNYMDAGIEVASYRGVPLVESSFLASQGQMTAVSLAASGAGSQLVASAYSYVVEVVSDIGDSIACAEQSITPTAGQNITLTWTTPQITDPDGNVHPNLLFRIFRTVAGGATGTETLYAVVSALDNNDNPITTFVDTGAPIVPANTSGAYATTVNNVGAAALPDAVTFPRIQANGQLVEDLWLMPRDPDIMLVAAVNEIRTKMLAPVNARTQQLALINDETLALRGNKFGAKLCRVRAV